MLVTQHMYMYISSMHHIAHRLNPSLNQPMLNMHMCIYIYVYTFVSILTPSTSSDACFRSASFEPATVYANMPRNSADTGSRSTVITQLSIYQCLTCCLQCKWHLPAKDSGHFGQWKATRNSGCVCQHMPCNARRRTRPDLTGRCGQTHRRSCRRSLCLRSGKYSRAYRSLLKIATRERS